MLDCAIPMSDIFKTTPYPSSGEVPEGRVGPENANLLTMRSTHKSDISQYLLTRNNKFGQYRRMSDFLSIGINTQALPPMITFTGFIINNCKDFAVVT